MYGPNIGEKMSKECHVINNFRNLEALGLWIYLCSQPKSWIIVKNQIKRHFGIGIEKTNKLISILVAHHLLKVVREKDVLGRFMSAKYVLNDPADFIHAFCMDQT